ncbi:MAG: hypothetical protein HY754_07195 [Nitrospirae bacterium]|nr:hypothetical protein [Nitrospirota bacterium]
MKNKFQGLEINPQDIINALLKDSRIKSVEFKDGEFHVLTTEGPTKFKMNFKKEKGIKGKA